MDFGFVTTQAAIA